MLKIKDPALQEAVLRLRDTQDDTDNLLLALTEAAINAETDPPRRLKLVQDALVAREKLRLAKQKADIENSTLIHIDTAKRAANVYVEVLHALIRENVEQELYFRIIDSVPMKLFDLASEDEELRKFAFSEKTWKEARQQFTGEPRQKLIEQKHLLE